MIDKSLRRWHFSAAIYLQMLGGTKVPPPMIEKFFKHNADSKSALR